MPVIPATRFSLPSTVKPGRTDHHCILSHDAFTDLVNDRAAFSAHGALEYAQEKTRNPEWLGLPRRSRLTFDQMQGWLTNGSDVLVAPSDAMLREVEDKVPVMSSGRAWVNSVAGAVPDVQAYLSGSPMSMRRRVKVQSDTSPLVIVMDLASSGGIDGALVQKRSAALLALVRVLSGRRPVELYVGSTGDAGPRGEWRDRDASYLWIRVDTSPLNLSRASFLCSVTCCRGLMYAAQRWQGHGYEGRWPYAAGVLKHADFETVVRTAFPHAGDVLAVPGIYIDDPAVKDPIGWVVANAKRYGGEA
jgi:hypothetical protein